MAETSVIIIDDEIGISRLCKRLLEQAGYASIAFNDPAEGIRSVEEHSYDLLLVDIQMPDMNGFEVIEKVRQVQPEIAVVIMTGFGTLETAIRALRQGADGLILKPFEDKDELIQTVREALDERHQKREISRLLAIRPLLDMTETLFSETRKDKLIDLILEAIIAYMRSDHAGIYQRKAGNKDLELIGSRGNPLPAESSGPNSGLVGRTDHWKVPIWVNKGGPGGQELQEVLKKHELGAVICSPIARGEEALVFLAGRDEGSNGFQLADLETFGLLVRQADIALENARLYNDLREYVVKVEDSQRALIQAEKMSAVGRLTASIAHEVNNPLQAVRNCMHLVGRKEISSDKQKEYLELAQGELDRLTGTVQRMLDFYRPGALEKKETDIHELIDLVLVLLEKQLSKNSINVFREFTKNKPKVNVVANQIQQVLFNLILNAMDAMPTGGDLSIVTKKINDNIEVHIHDTGLGVPKEIGKNLFEPFTSSKEEGTGLGLSVSYGIVTAHGGSLELNDHYNKGACFCISLPCEDEK